MKTFFAFLSALTACAAFAQTPGIGDTRPAPPSLDEQRGPVGGGTGKQATPDVGAEKAHSRSDRALNRCEKMDDAQREHIVQVLREARWVLGGLNGAAARMGIPRTTLIYKMRRLGIRPQQSDQRS